MPGPVVPVTLGEFCNMTVKKLYRIICRSWRRSKWESAGERLWDVAQEIAALMAGELKLTRGERRVLRAAIDLATASEREFIEAHRVGWRNGKRVIHESNRPATDQAKRFIGRMQKVRKRLA